MIISILYSRQLWPEDIDSAPTNNFWDANYLLRFHHSENTTKVFKDISSVSQN